MSKCSNDETFGHLNIHSSFEFRHSSFHLYNSPVTIGPITLPTPFCQAGLAGYSDRAMRLVARRHGCPYAVTESLLDIIMLSGGQGLRKSIDINDEDHPIAGQIIGSDADTMTPAAQILADHG